MTRLKFKISVPPPVAVFIWRAADSSLAVLDFFLAHRAVPYVPCTSRYGLFAPRGIARSEIRFAWLWGKRRKPCVKQSQNGSVLDLFAAVNGRRRIRSWPCLIVRNWTEWNNFVKNYETQLHSSERCIIQDKRVFEENSTGTKTKRSGTILQKLWNGAKFLVGRSRALASEPVTWSNPLECSLEKGETECKDCAEPNNLV